MSERIVSDPSQHGWVEVDGKWVWDASGGGAGAGMVISETEPTDKVEGMQWLNPTTGLVLFWDDEKWLQMPTTGAAGKDGADGVDGVDGLWTDNGDTSISYTDGNVGIGTDSPASVVTSASTCLVVSADSTNSASASFQTANAQWEIGSFENRNGNFGVFNNATVSFPLTIDTGGNVGIGASSLAELLNVGTAGQTVNTKIQINSTADSVGAVYFGDGTSGSDTYSGYLQYSHADDIMSIGAGGSERMSIDELGNVRMLGGDMWHQLSLGNIDADTNTRSRIMAPMSNGNDLTIFYAAVTTDKQEKNIVFGGGTSAGEPANKLMFRTESGFGATGGGTDRMSIDSSGRVDITGSLYVNGTPKIGTSELIETLSTLRDATKDETVDVRQALASACDKLIEKYEAMQSTATQEISDE